MYRFFVSNDQIGEKCVRITGPDVNHIKNVLRMNAGEKILVGNGADREYLCRLETISHEVRAEILSVKEGAAELPVKSYLFQGFPKSDKMEQIIQKSVELGVYRIIPVMTRRVVVKLDPKKEEAKLRRYQAVAESAAKQSGRLVIPKVGPVMDFEEALAFSQSLSMTLIPYEHAAGMAGTRQILSRIQPGMEVGIFIGPEGGFEEREMEVARGFGAEIGRAHV